MRDEEEDDDDVRSGPGWLATLFGAALLLAAGFAVGIVVGAVREEPAMLLQYVTGKSASLPAPQPQPAAPAQPAAIASVAPPAGPAAEPEEDAAPVAAPAAPRAQAPVPAPALAPPPRASQPVVAAAAPSSGPAASISATRARFAVQVGAFADSSEAERLEAQLKRKGLPAYVQPATGAKDSRWRVRIGPLGSRDEADRLAARVKAQDKLPVWVLEDNG